MTRADAQTILAAAKWTMLDMGLIGAACACEDAEVRLLWKPVPLEAIRAYADSVLPRGRRGRIKLVLNRPETARAEAFVAAVLRSIVD